MCETIVLSQKGETIVGQCPECHTFSIWQHNLLLIFTPQQFSAFADFAAELDPERAMFPFPNGEERLVMRTPQNDICFAFNLSEWEDFNVAVKEATYMQEVYQLIR